MNAELISDYRKAAGILVLSGLTDALDGLIARKTGQITDLGKALDPLADKLTQIAVVGAMSVKKPYVLPLLILFIVKEFYLLVNNLVLMRKNKRMDGAMWFGKLATIIFYLCMFILVVFPYIPRNETIILVTVTAIFQIISFIGYGRWFKSKYKEKSIEHRMDE